MSKGKTTLAERLRQLHAMLGSKNQQERETALAKINELLEKHRKNWTDLGELMAGRSGSDPVWNIVEDDQTEPPAGDLTVLDMVMAVINAHLDVSADDALALALWILLTYHYDKFEYSPRLAALSPVKGCGKTTVLKVVSLLAARAKLLNSPSAASLYHLIDRGHPTLAIDEGDGLGLHINPAIRNVMLSGHNVGSNIPRVIDGEPKEFDTYGPLAIAAIGTLPLQLMDRSVIVHMEKSQRRDLRRLDRNSPNIEVVHAVFREIVKWARKPLKNNIDNILPNDSSRHADNWRPLICVADSFGKVWGKKARDAAASYKRNYSDEDLRVIFLADIRTAFNQLGTDPALSKKLVPEVRAVNELWDEYPTPHGPRKLTEAGMAALLKPFRPRIRSVTIWPPGRKRTDTVGSGKGYYRSQFATAWAKYCPEEDDEPATGKVVAYLGKR
jgi:hypothetical protein